MASSALLALVYLSEIFPNAIRSSGQSLASFWLWLLTAIVAGVFPIVASVSAASAFLIFCLCMCAQFVVVQMFFPETRGRSLESMPN